MPSATELESMLVRLIGDGSSYQKMLATAQTATTATANHIQRTVGRIEVMTATVKGFGASVVSTGTQLLGVASGLGLAFKGVQLAAEAEEMEVAFGVMLKSVGAGKQIVKDLQEFAAKTPLNMPDLQRATKTLLQFGIAGGDVLPTLKMLGDTAGGNAERLQRMALAFGQMNATGRLMGEEVNQMIEAGFNPLQEISRTTGKSMAVLRDQMQKGLLTVDMVKNAFKTATSAGGNFENGMEKASQTLSGLFSTMQDDLGAFMRNVGKDLIELFRLKDVVKAVSEAAAEATEWFRGLSPEIKRVGAVVALVAGVVGSLAVLWPVIMAVAVPAFVALKAVILALISPLGLILAAVGLLVAAVVKNQGGIVATFQLIKQKALEAWAWTEPVRQAVVSLFHTIVDTGTQLFNRFASFVSDVWRRISDSANVDWNRVREVIRDAILFAEFTILNFSQVMETAWAGIKYFAVAALNTILENVGLVLAGPAVLAYLATNVSNWVEMWMSIERGAKDMFTKLALNIASFVEKVRDAIAGRDVDWTEFWEDFKGGIEFKGKGIEIKMLKDLEDRLKQEFEALKDKTGQSWEEFRKMKLKEFGLDEGFVGPPKPPFDAYEKSANTATGAVKKLGHEVKKLDAALVGSAENTARKFEYISHLYETGRVRSAGQPSQSILQADFTKQPEVLPDRAQQVTKIVWDKEALSVLLGIEKNTKEVADRPVMEFEEADLD